MVQYKKPLTKWHIFLQYLILMYDAANGSYKNCFRLAKIASVKVLSFAWMLPFLVIASESLQILSVAENRPEILYADFYKNPRSFRPKMYRSYFLQNRAS